MQAMNKPVAVILITNALCLAGFVGAGVALLAAGHTAWGSLCIAGGVLVDEALLYWLLKRYATGSTHVKTLTTLFESALDTQSQAIHAEQSQITGLQAMMADAAFERRIQQTMPNLAALVEGLERVESSLPDMLLQTCHRIAELRYMAACTKEQVQGLGSTSAGR